MYDAALDAIREVLSCERAAVLIFDDANVMRFVAWRDLSDQYRRSVEGRSPWTRDAKDPQPICIEDIDTAELPEPLKGTVRMEGIGALAFVPLVANGEVIGKFMTYYMRRMLLRTARSILLSRSLAGSASVWRAGGPRKL